MTESEVVAIEDGSALQYDYAAGHCRQIGVKTSGDNRQVIVAFDQALESGEALTGSPTAVEQSTSALTITTPALSTDAKMVNGRAVPASEAVEFRVSGGTAGYMYEILVSTASATQTLTTRVRIEIP